MTNIASFCQYLVAGSSLLASLSVGCSVGYPSVLLRQLNSNDSSIQLDWDTASWIGSIHGIAGIPSLIMPVFMQWRGRKLAFIIACLVSIIGWIISFTATNATSILISESIQGFGSHSLFTVSMFSMSEMLSPQTRKVSMSLYLVTQTLGMGLIGFIGSYLHWKTVSLVVCAPLVVVTLLATCLWPESPSWLAYKGEYKKCTNDFKRLRGSGDIAQMELEELILAQKEKVSRDNISNKPPLLKHVWLTLQRRDFYVPVVHIFIILQLSYWDGSMAHVIYASDIIERATQSKDVAFYGSMFFNCILFVSCVLGTFLLKFFQPKRLILMCVSCAIVFMSGASVVNISQTAGLISEDSYISFYFLVGYMFTIAMILPIALPLSAELMPVKYRGIAGPLHVIFPCLMHTSLLKSVPYMLKYFNLYGMLLVFAANATLCTLYMWKYIPETKGRTLQQLEDYYNYGNFDKSRRVNMDNKCLTELIT